MTDSEKLKIAVDCMEKCIRDGYSGKEPLCDLLDNLKEALSKINPQPRTMTMREAVEQNLKFNLDGMDFKTKDEILYEINENVPVEAHYILTNQNETVEIIE